MYQLLPILLEIGCWILAFIGIVELIRGRWLVTHSNQGKGLLAMIEGCRNICLGSGIGVVTTGILTHEYKMGAIYLVSFIFFGLRIIRLQKLQTTKQLESPQSH